MSRVKYRLEEGWASFVLLTLMVLSVVWSVRAADWTDGLGILQWVALGGVVTGLLLATRRRLPGPVAHLLSLAVGAIWVTLMLVIVFAPPVVPPAVVAPARGLLGRATVMYTEVLWWLRGPVGSEVWLSNFVFVLSMAVLAWLLSYASAWFVFRTHWVWGAIVPTGAACLLNIYYAPPRLVLYFVLYCLCALLLLVRTHVYLRQVMWRQAGVNYNIDVDLTFLRDGAIVALLAVALAWGVPVAASSSRVSDLWASFQDPWHEVQTRWSRLFTALNYQGQSSLVQFGRTMTLGGAVNLSNVPVFEVQAAEPHYWRAVSYQNYTGGGWANKDEAVEELMAGERGLSPMPYAMQKEFTHTVRMLQDGESLLFFAGQPLSSSVAARARLSYLPGPEGVRATEVSMLQSLRTFRRNQTYTIASHVSVAAAAQLRAAGTDYPQWVSSTYLQLPSDLPQRVRQLGREVAAGAATPYDQAMAIQEYLRRMTYDQYISPPPVGRDVVDWFLFENRRGYCDYYASAMAVMCRTLGIPARVTQGYTPGEYVPTSRTYLVRQLDAHAWPELYFPGYGWIEFEPTSSEPAISRPEEDEGLPLPGAGLVPGSTRGEEDRFGPDDDIGVGEDIVDVTVAEQGARRLRPLHLALGVAGVLLASALGFAGWWWLSLRGLDAAARVYERMRRLGGLVGATHQVHQTPIEYGESLVRALGQGQDEVRCVTALYVKSRFSKDRLSKAEEAELGTAWAKLRAVIILRMLVLRRGRRKPVAGVWLPGSALRPRSPLE